MVVTFYSYKGGVGRSMALANVAQWFVLRGARVVMIDWDLEAPGLENYFFDTPEALAAVRSRPGVIDMLYTLERQWHGLGLSENPSDEEVTAALEASVAPPTAYLFRIQSELIDGSGGALWLLPAGRRVSDDLDDYAGAVQRFDWEGFYERYRGQCYFDWLRQHLSDPAIADIVLVDSRTGVTEMGGVCTRQLADVVVCLSAPNRGNLEGVVAMASTFVDDELLEARKHRRISTLIVPARIENTERDQRNDFKNDFARSTYQFVPEALSGVPDAFWRLRIPYVPYYAYQETLAVGMGGADEEIEEAYHRLAAPIALLSPNGSRIRELCEADISASPFGHGSGTSVLRSDALAAEALNEAWEGLDATARERLLTLLARALRINDGDHSATTVRTGIGPLNADERRLLEPLAALGVLTVRRDGSSSETLEVPESVHIERWPFVRDWLAVPGNTQFVTARQAINDALREWRRANNDTSALLRGRLLGEAESLMADHRGDLAADELAFIAASQAHHEEERSRTEAQERALLAAKSRVRRLRIATAVSMVLLMVVVAGWLALVRYGPRAFQVWQIKQEAPALVASVDGKNRNKIISDWAKALIVSGDAESAGRAVAVLREPMDRARALRTLASGLWGNSQTTRAQTAFDEAFKTLAAQSNPDYVAFLELGEGAQQAGDLERTKRAADRARSAPREGTDPESAPGNLARIARLYVACKDWDAAHELTSEAYVLAGAIPQPYAKALAFSDVADAEMAGGAPVRAQSAAELSLAAIDAIDDVPKRAGALDTLGPRLVRVAPSLLQAVLDALPDDSKSLEVSMRARLSGSRTRILAVAGTQAAAQAESDRFLRLAVEIKDPLERLETLRKVMDDLAQQGDGAFALRIAPEVALLAGQIQRQNSTNAGVAAAVYSALSTAGQVMAREGHGDAAIDHVSALAVPEEQSVAMADVADLLLQRGQLGLAALAAERAASAVQQMPIGTEVPLEVLAARMNARLRIADTLMQVNRQADAARVLEELLGDYRERIGRSQPTGLSAATLSRSLARVGQFRLAREVANAAQLNDKLVAFSVIVKEHARRSNPEIRPDIETGSH